MNVENNSFCDVLVDLTRMRSTMRGSAVNICVNGPLNIETSYLSHIFMSTLFRERLMHVSLISFLLDVSAVAGHGTVLAALLFITK